MKGFIEIRDREGRTSLLNASLVEQANIIRDEDGHSYMELILLSGRCVITEDSDGLRRELLSPDTDRIRSVLRDIHELLRARLH